MTNLSRYPQFSCVASFCGSWFRERSCETPRLYLLLSLRPVGSEDAGPSTRIPRVYLLGCLP